MAIVTSLLIHEQMPRTKLILERRASAPTANAHLVAPSHRAPASQCSRGVSALQAEQRVLARNVKDAHDSAKTASVQKAPD
eukprot:3721418-Pleurochrysis_carterae.AAC.3